jgi:hypothetical protein
MEQEIKDLIHPVIVGVAINLILPALIKPYATENQITPPNGADNLELYDQLIHMFVHHAQVPLSSSIIIAIIVSLSIYIGKIIKKKLI